MVGDVHTASDDTERWVTDSDLQAARRRFAERIPGFEPPVAYGVARLDDGQLTFGHVNGPSSTHRLPAVVLATFCGYSNRSGVFPLGTEDFARAVAALEPAEAATHWQHPNLWSWRALLRDADPGSAFLAFFLADLRDPIVDGRDAAFRSRVHDEDPSGHSVQTMIPRTRTSAATRSDGPNLST